MKITDKYIIAAFCVGLLFGIAVGRFSARWWFRHHWGPPTEKQLQRRLDRFSARLDLTAAQRTQVEAIFRTKREKMNALFEEIGPKLEAVRNSTTEEIRKLLTPEQQAKFDKFHAKHETEWKESPLYHLIYDRPNS